MVIAEIDSVQVSTGNLLLQTVSVLCIDDGDGYCSTEKKQRFNGNITH